MSEVRMSKEDRAAFLEWKRGMAGDTTILIRPFSGPTFAAWESACAYKDKRIAELEKIIDLDTERFRELGEEIQELKKRIAELEYLISKYKVAYVKYDKRIEKLNKTLEGILSSSQDIEVVVSEALSGGDSDE